MAIFYSYNDHAINGYPLVNVYITIENGHRNSEFSHETLPTKFIVAMVDVVDKFNINCHSFFLMGKSSINGKGNHL